MTRSDDEGLVLWRCRRLRIKSAMTPKGRECVFKNESENNGHRGRVRQTSTGVGAQARPKWEGRLPKRRTKCLTLTERRLSFTFGEGTPRPEGQAFRVAVRWAVHFGLDSSVPSHQGEGTKKKRFFSLSCCISKLFPIFAAQIKPQSRLVAKSAV